MPKNILGKQRVWRTAFQSASLRYGGIVYVRAEFNPADIVAFLNSGKQLLP